MRLPIDLSALAQGEALSDFPLLVRLDPSRIDYGVCRSDGLDVCFRTEEGGLVYHEIESWSPGGESLIWIKAPRIEALPETTRIWMYYGSTLPAAGNSPRAVWSNGYAAVWHGTSFDLLAKTFYPDSAGLSIGESLTPNRAVSSLDGGAVGRFYRLASQLDGILVPSNPRISDLANFSLELWILDSGATKHSYPEYLVSKGPLSLSIRGLGSLDFDAGFDSQPLRLSRAGLWTTDAWTALGFVWGGGGTGEFYSNGLGAPVSGQVSGARASDAGANLVIGNSSSNPHNQGAIADLDEIRISSVARSAAWMKAQYLAQLGTSLVFGEPEAVFAAAAGE